MSIFDVLKSEGLGICKAKQQAEKEKGTQGAAHRFITVAMLAQHNGEFAQFADPDKPQSKGHSKWCERLGSDYKAIKPHLSKAVRIADTMKTLGDNRHFSVTYGRGEDKQTVTIGKADYDKAIATASQFVDTGTDNLAAAWGGNVTSAMVAEAIRKADKATDEAKERNANTQQEAFNAYMNEHGSLTIGDVTFEPGSTVYIPNAMDKAQVSVWSKALEQGAQLIADARKQEEQEHAAKQVAANIAALEHALRHEIASPTARTFIKVLQERIDAEDRAKEQAAKAQAHKQSGGTNKRRAK